MSVGPLKCRHGVDQDTLSCAAGTRCSVCEMDDASTRIPRPGEPYRVDMRNIFGPDAEYVSRWCECGGRPYVVGYASREILAACSICDKPLPLGQAGQA